MELTTLQASAREINTAGQVKDLRKEGSIPAVYYGKTQEPTTLTISAADLRKVYAPGKRYTLLDLVIDGKGGNPAIVYNVQKDIIKGDVVHVDFMEIKEDRLVKVTIPVHLEGVAYGVKTEGGTLYQSTRKITVKSLPSKIPTEFLVDVSDFRAKSTFYLENMDLGECKAVSPARAVIVTISKGRGK